MTIRLVTLAALLVALALPAAGVAQDPFGPIPQAPPQEQPDPAPAPQEDEGLSRMQELLIGAAGVVLLFGIGWAIVRDAKHAAPVDKRNGYVPPEERPKRTKTPPSRRVQHGRRRAKAARRSRKKNR
jgi:hypothetical protein